MSWQTGSSSSARARTPKAPYLIFANPSLFAAKHLPSAYELTTATLEPLTDRNSRSRSNCGGPVLQERVLGRATSFQPGKGDPACQEMGVAMSIAIVQPLTSWEETGRRVGGLFVCFL